MKDLERYLKDPVFMEMVKKYAKESEELNEKRKSKIDKLQDKIIKSILKKKEAAKIINKLFGLEITKENLETSQNSFVTSELKYREADIVYKIKGKNIVFLFEHQSTVDYLMAYRVLNYQAEIMRANEIESGKKEDKQCLVIPIVIYTGKEKWTAGRYIKEIQDGFEKEEWETPEIIGLLGFYELIDVHEYTKEELLEEESLLSKVMLIEKERRTEEILETVYEIVKVIKNEEDREIIYNFMELILEEKIGAEKARKIIKDAIESANGGKGSDGMFNCQRVIREENERIREEGENNIIKLLLKSNMQPKEISERTGISISKILSLKK